MRRTAFATTIPTTLMMWPRMIQQTHVPRPRLLFLLLMSWFNVGPSSLIFQRSFCPLRRLAPLVQNKISLIAVGLISKRLRILLLFVVRTAFTPHLKALLRSTRNFGSSHLIRRKLPAPLLMLLSRLVLIWKISSPICGVRSVMIRIGMNTSPPSILMLRWQSLCRWRKRLHVVLLSMALPLIKFEIAWLKRRTSRFSPF